jgi:hypothetical protein
VDGLTTGRVVTGRGTRLPMVGGYVALLRSHLGAIIVLVVLGTVAGGFLSSRLPHRFVANAAIELPDVPTYVDTDPEPPAPDRTTIDTTAQLVYSEPVFTAVEAATGLAETKVRAGLGVSAYPLSRVLIVSFAASSAELAMNGASAASEALVHERGAVLAGAQLERALELKQRLNKLKTKSQNKIRQFTPQTQEISFLLQQIEVARQAGADAGGNIIDEADSAKRVNAHPELQVISGMVVGLLIGIGYSWWRRDKHLHHDPRIIGLVAKVRPGRRTGPRSRPPARGPQPRPSHSHGS